GGRGGRGSAGLAPGAPLGTPPARGTWAVGGTHNLFQPLPTKVPPAALPPAGSRPRPPGTRRTNRTARWAVARAGGWAARGAGVGEGAAIPYDTLIVAAGARHSYFGHDEWEAAAPGLKSVEDALEIRRRVLTAFEAAEAESDPERRAEWLTFVVVGGGPTGV